LKRTIAGKDLPEDAKSELIALHEEVGVLKEQNKDIQDKLHKAKTVNISPSAVVQSPHVCRSLSNRRTNYSKKSKQRRVDMVLSVTLGIHTVVCH
jgi:protein HOOK3